MGKKYRSDALAAVHETALGLTEAGVMGKRTMKAFDAMCLTPVKKLTAAQIRQIGFVLGKRSFGQVKTCLDKLGRTESLRGEGRQMNLHKRKKSGSGKRGQNHRGKMKAH